MCHKTYTTKITVDQGEFYGAINLSADDYAEWLNGEFNATEFVLGVLRQNPPYEGCQFDERHVLLIPQT